MDYEDAGDDLAMLVEELCSSNRTVQFANTLGIAIPKIFGKNKKIFSIRSELACAYMAVAIHVVNLHVNEKVAKQIIDSLLGKSSKYFLHEIEKNVKGFNNLYSERLAKYFQILREDKPMVGMSFHIYKYLGYDGFGNLEKQMLISELLGVCIKNSSEIVKEVSGSSSDMGLEGAGTASVIDELKEELSTWRADAAKAGLEMIVAVGEGDEKKFEALQSKLTFAQFETITKYLDRMGDDEFDEEDEFDDEEEINPLHDYEDYHAALDDIVYKLRGPISDIFDRQENFDDNTSSLACELIAYAAACHAKNVLRIDIPQGSWNSFQTSVEYRAMQYVSEEVINAAKRKQKPPPNTFVSYVTPAFNYLEQMERIVQYESSTETISAGPFLHYFAIPKSGYEKSEREELELVLADAFNTCKNFVVPDVKKVFS
jgi:hypothetical protein